MQNRQFFTYKFNSSRLKEFDYNIQLTFDEAQEYNEVISLFDNQMLRSIRKIHNREVNENKLNELIKQKNYLKSKESSSETINELLSIHKKINEILFIPEYITIVMEHPSHYKYLYKNGLLLNNKKFVRFSCSAGQARVSTVVFVEEETTTKLDIILDNGRDLNKELVPSKMNAYKGLSGSATQIVSTPRFCIVPDYESESTVKVNFVTETPYNQDDIIDVREITEKFNRFDGQGLISYEMSKKWADELGLDYIPAQWCIRQNYIKGMLNTFPIHEFCEKENNGNYMIKSSYTDDEGNSIITDLRNTDVILTESQFKFWDSFPSIEVYQENCIKNELSWGVSLHSPKKDKDILKMNYQFLQTLDLNKKDIEKLCDKFINWINGVTSENVYYTILFLLGTNVNEEKIEKYLDKGENHWIKSLIVNPKLINDKYIKRKVYDLIKRKIQGGCLGEIILDGNFQTLVSDPFAMMQHVCGLEVKGLLNEREYYSNYWNQQGISKVDSMRAPLTYRSEHLLLCLIRNKELDRWYRYNYTGIIVNIHGHETMNWAGSDFDYDIIATTSDETVINGVYTDELPVVYEALKAKKIKINKDDLFKADLFSFGSIIGQITNKSTTAYSLLPLLKKGSKEYEVTMSRIKMCTKLQSAQIDKAKIGQEVKGIPKLWTEYQKVNGNDSNEISKEKGFMNSLLLDKHPYFFIYLYNGTRKKYKDHVKRYNITSQQRFGMTLDELKAHKRKTKEQFEFLSLFDQYSPVIDSDCVMNNICKYIESFDFRIRKILKNEDANLYNLYLDDSVKFDEERYKLIVNIYNKHKKMINQTLSSGSTSNSKKSKFDVDMYNEIIHYQDKFKNRLMSICSNEKEVVNYLVHLFYVDKPSLNKDLLWNMYDDVIFNNIKDKSNVYYVPVLSENGEIDYLNNKYSLKKVNL